MICPAEQTQGKQSRFIGFAPKLDNESIKNNKGNDDENGNDNDNDNDNDSDNNNDNDIDIDNDNDNDNNKNENENDNNNNSGHVSNNNIGWAKQCSLRVKYCLLRLHSKYFCLYVFALSLHVH